MDEKTLKELSELLGVKPKLCPENVPGHTIVNCDCKPKNGGYPFPGQIITPVMKDVDFDVEFGEFSHNGISVPMKDSDFTGLGTDIHKALHENRVTIVKGDHLVFTSGGWIMHKGIADHKNCDGEWFENVGGILFVPENIDRTRNYATYKVVDFRKKNSRYKRWPLNIGECKEHCVKMEK